jgi:hypothetical protein
MGRLRRADFPVRAPSLRVRANSAAACDRDPIGLARAVIGRLLAAIVAHHVNNLLPGVVLFMTLTGTLTM